MDWISAVSEETTPPRLHRLPLSHNLIEEKVDTCIEDVRVLSEQVRVMNVLLVHQFDELKSLINNQNERLSRVEGSVSVLRDHTKEQWRALAENRRATKNSDPRGLKDLDEDTKIRRLPSLSEIDTRVKTQLDQHELSKYQKRSERILAGAITLIVGLFVALFTALIKGAK